MAAGGAWELISPRPGGTGSAGRGTCDDRTAPRHGIDMTDTLHVWAGRFGTADALHAFLDESYGDDDDVPISAFAASQGVSFYDHDWLECRFNDDAAPQDEFIAAGVPAPYGDTAASRARERDIDGVDSVILFAEAWDGTPRSSAADPTLWYLGEFDERILQASRSPADRAPSGLDPAWWTDFPSTDAELRALEERADARRDAAPARAKLALMYLSGRFVERDEKRGEEYLARVSRSPKVLHECLLANGEAGDAEAWLQLFRLHERKFEGAATDEERARYLERAVAAGSAEAKVSMAMLLQYGWLRPRMAADDSRALTLLLEAHETGDRPQDYALYCLYAKEGSKVHDPVEATRRLTVDANRTGSRGSLSRLGHRYAEGEGVERDPARACQYLWLTLCQDAEPNLERHRKRLDAAGAADLEAGRTMARAWVERYAPQAAHFEGVRCDPFERHLADRT